MITDKELRKENEASKKGFCWQCGSTPHSFPCTIARVHTSEEDLKKMADAGRLDCYKKEMG